MRSTAELLSTGRGLKEAPCREACPAGIDVPRYIRHIANGEFGRALAVVRERIPFPAVCGHACVHPCEAKCARQQLDQPIAIRLLKRAAEELGRDAWEPEGATTSETGKKVAIIGSGPCGLSAAYYLARRGHQVVVLEALAKPGGMMRYGIPEYRLPREKLDREIAEIAGIGVEIRTNNKVESLAGLREKYHAVLVATGTWRGARMGIEGEDSPKVIDGLFFLREVNAGTPVAIGKKVVVVGGGNTAIDAARSAVRLGAKEVIIMYRRTRAEMPASDEEIDGALEEAVRMEFLTAPVKIVERQDSCRLVCQRMELGRRKDPSGRPQAVPLADSDFAVDCDTVIMAIGQMPVDAKPLGLVTDDSGAIQINKETLETPQAGIFAAGDAVCGPSSIIEAIAQGRMAAESIDKFLGGDGLIDGIPLAPAESSPVPDSAPSGTCRPCVPTVSLGQRLTTFGAVELGYDEVAAVKEARRCLACDVRSYLVQVDDRACKECGYCAKVCRLGVFGPANYFNERGYKPMLVARQDRCIGCMDCFFSCPDFAIEVTKTDGGCC